MTILRFAFVVDGEVSHVTEIDDQHDSPVVPRMIAAYRQKPIFVDVSNTDIGKGWTWDGQDFSPPAE